LCTVIVIKKKKYFLPNIFLKFFAENVVLVTMQYRLGTLGFLSTEDSAAPGILLYFTVKAGNPVLPLY
jgi:hypothetical protein